MKTFFPLNEEKYKNLTPHNINLIDSLLYRFSKLQDTLGNKIIKSALEILEEETENLPFIDILYKAEK